MKTKLFFAGIALLGSLTAVRLSAQSGGGVGGAGGGAAGGGAGQPGTPQQPGSPGGGVGGNPNAPGGGAAGQFKPGIGQNPIVPFPNQNTTNQMRPGIPPNIQQNPGVNPVRPGFPNVQQNPEINTLPPDQPVNGGVNGGVNAARNFGVRPGGVEPDSDDMNGGQTNLRLRPGFPNQFTNGMGGFNTNVPFGTATNPFNGAFTNRFNGTVVTNPFNGTVTNWRWSRRPNTTPGGMNPPNGNLMQQNPAR